MISVEDRKEAERLLRETDLSNTGIAKRVGISKGTVGRIRRGEYKVKYVRKSETKEAMSTPTMTGKVGRCRICRRMVKLPCHACYVESLPRI